MEAEHSDRGEVVDTLRDLARGTVHRSRHGLVLGDVDYTADFEDVLRSEGYAPARLNTLTVPRGVRYPAFILREGLAYFGHVFREKFTESEDRLLFGSVVRDGRGDWAVLLTRRSSEVVWVNLGEGSPFDDERPSGGR